MRTRLKDIAEELALSPGLVSGVLNGRENVWASEDTRRKIFEAASRLKYEHNGPAKQKPAPMTGSFELACCRTQHVRSTEMGDVIETMSFEAERLGLSLVVRSFEDLNVAAEYYSGQPKLFADFVLVWSDGQDVSAITDSITSLAVPCLVYSAIEGKRLTVPQYSLNVEDIVAGAIDHMRVLGHRRIAFLGVRDESSSDRLMREAFIAKIKQYNGSVPPTQWICKPELQFADYRQAVHLLLRLPEAEQPTGFFIAAGNLAWTVLEQSLAETGLVLGFNKDNRIGTGLFRGPFHLANGDALALDVREVASQLAAAIRAVVSSPDDGATQLTPRFIPRLARIPSFRSGNSKDPRVVIRKPE